MPQILPRPNQYSPWSNPWAQRFSYPPAHSHILVSNGSKIPVKGSGTTSFSSHYPNLTLKNILYAPKIIKNLVSVRQFTIDNCVSVEFDPFGFSVKDLKRGTILTRCNSVGNLYPVSSPSSSSSLSQYVFAALFSEV